MEQRMLTSSTHYTSLLHVSPSVRYALLLCVSSALSQIYPPAGVDQHFYPYGYGTGDTALDVDDDGYSDQINSPVDVMFFGNAQRTIWVSLRFYK